MASPVVPAQISEQVHFPSTSDFGDLHEDAAAYARIIRTIGMTA